MRKVLLFFAVALMAASCSQAQHKKGGFLTKEELPDALKFLPAPPESGPAYDEDVKSYEWGKKQREEPGVRDRCLHLDTTDIKVVFNEALGFKMLSNKHKEIMNLVSWAVKDARKVSEPVKEHYKRQKPFQVFNEPSLKLKAESSMSSSTYAYPSGHAVRSWMYAFVLADVAPECADALNKCAEEYCTARVIMGRHWQSDIDAGKMLSAKVYEKLKESPAYKEQLELAREQYETIKKK